MNTECKNRLFDFLLKNYFSYAFYFFLTTGLFFLLLDYPKGTVNFLVNEQIATYLLDHFFIVYSDIFQGYVVLLLSLILSFFSKRKMFMILLAGLLVLIFVSICKELIFGNIPRPTKYFPLNSFVHKLKDLSIYKEQYTFPSGHTALAFAVLSLLSSFFRNKIVTLLMFFIALGAGFSRIYLLQHFFVDVYVGAVIGFFVTIITIWIFDKFIHVSEKPLISIRHRA